MDKDNKHTSRNMSWYFYLTEEDLYKISKEIISFLYRKIGKTNLENIRSFDEENSKLSLIQVVSKIIRRFFTNVLPINVD